MTDRPGGGEELIQQVVWRVMPLFVSFTRGLEAGPSNRRWSRENSDNAEKAFRECLVEELRVLTKATAGGGK